ncbi:MAG: V-type ATP synthase subunit F [Thermodesulfobacteriota bacterium]|nr:V-type ATP synthase subunit F [Thermodesulfobacteriota bacterium]MEA3385513.1 V-type ATP synthase subunit F [Thermodesulfobacteriota bacterium]
MHILVIADHLTCMAFSLGGISTRTVKTREDAVAAMESAQNSHDIGLVLITERIADSIRSKVDEMVFEVHKPLVVEIPDTEGPLPDRRSTGELMVSLMRT